MGLIDMIYYKYLRNVDKCKSINDAYESHMDNNDTVIVELNDIYSMLALLGFGTGSALVSFTAEIISLVSVS